MKIHHATATKAKNIGLILAPSKDDLFEALWERTGNRVRHPDPKTALDVMALWKKGVEDRGWVNFWVTTEFDKGQYEIQYWATDVSGSMVCFHTLGWAEMPSVLEAEAKGHNLNLFKMNASVHRPRISKLTKDTTDALEELSGPKVPDTTPKPKRKAPDDLAKAIDALNFILDDGKFDADGFVEWLEKCGVVVDRESKWYKMKDLMATDKTASGRFRMIGRQKLATAIRKGTAEIKSR